MGEAFCWRSRELFTNFLIQNVQKCLGTRGSISPVRLHGSLYQFQQSGATDSVRKRTGNVHCWPVDEVDFNRSVITLLSESVASIACPLCFSYKNPFSWNGLFKSKTYVCYHTVGMVIRHNTTPNSNEPRYSRLATFDLVYKTVSIR